MPASATAASRSPSLLLTTLAGAAPAFSGMPPRSAIRSHRLDDARKPGASVGAVPAADRDATASFTAADKALIRRVHGYMAPLQLLGVLNERLACDHGAGAVLFTIDQLKAEIASVATALPATANDWGALRKVLAKARREGILDVIDEQVINDFAVVYSLTQKQVMTLKDILLNPNGEE